jgi:iron complex outermembrane recepter protein
MVSPEQIERIDMLYGPYSSEYSGNAMGGVMRIITRSPQETELTFEQAGALQSFSLYDTDNHYSTSQTSATAGGRSGGLSWFVGGNFQNSFSQPLSLVTASSPPGGATGGIVANNKLGQPADVLGVGGLLHTREANILTRLDYDLTSTWRMTYLVDYWRNDADSGVTSYLQDGSGQPTFGRSAAFASNRYSLLENHLMNGLSLKSDSKGVWDAEAVLTYYDFLEDRQLSPAAVTAGTGFTPNGRLADLGGTQWGTADLKGLWRPFGFGGSQEVTLGAHADRYLLNNPTFNTTAWQDLDTRAGLFSSGRGRTETEALWLQDVWTLSPAWQTTVGARVEHWRASGGYNFSGTVGVNQPSESANGFSPKATLSWRPSRDWTLTGSVARSVRFPTVGELYQLVSTGSTFTSPNPDLEPERDLSGEIAMERAIPEGSVRLSLFQENTRDALTSQTSTLAGYPVPVTFVVNVGEVRNRGIELAGQKADLLLPGFDLEGSVTFVDSTTLSDPSFVSVSGTTADGKHAPYVPRWRATVVATYRPTARWALTVGGRYSGQMFSTLDNTDNTPHVFGAFDSFLVFDAKAHYDVTNHLSASLGVDNLNNKVYFLFHPFPQRTVVADLHLKL